MDLPMSNADIVASYKNAAFPDKQIGILADLNACKKDDIKKVLQEAGVKVQAPCESAKRRTPHDYTKAKECYDRGLVDREIAEETGIPRPTVAYWRKQNGLPPNTVKSKPETAENANETYDAPQKAENAAPKTDDIAHVIGDAAPPDRRPGPGMTINQDFEDAVRLMEAEHDLKEANRTVESQKRSLIAAHNKCIQLEEKLRAAEMATGGNPDLMRTVELTFDLLNKMWERI